MLGISYYILLYYIIYYIILDYIKIYYIILYYIILYIRAQAQPMPVRFLFSKHGSAAGSVSADSRRLEHHVKQAQGIHQSSSFTGVPASSTVSCIQD